MALPLSLARCFRITLQQQQQQQLHLMSAFACSEHVAMLGQ